MNQRTLTVDQDSKNLTVIMWLLTVFFSILSPIAFYLLKKDEPFILAHAKEALNWSITVVLAYIVASILTVVVIGLFMVPVIWIANLVFSVLALMAALKGEHYTIPFCLRLIK